MLFRNKLLGVYFVSSQFLSYENAFPQNTEILNIPSFGIVGTIPSWIGSLSNLGKLF